MSEAEHGRDMAVQEGARRQLEICNACRYCEGFCAVFPAMMRRRAFLDGDVNFLANLCHNCKGCYHACQYSPPHVFDINLPKVLAEARLESYEKYAWPSGLGGLFRRNGLVVALIAAIGVTLAVLLAARLTGEGQLFSAQTGPGAFYRIMPWSLMAGLAAASFLFAILALVMGGLAFWKDIAGGVLASPQAIGQAASDILTLRYLGGGHEGRDGCNDISENFSQARRWFHHGLFYGFTLCFASTTVATIYDHVFQSPAPYPVLSLPVLLGLCGGVGMTIGCCGLLGVKLVTDPAPEARRVLGGDYALLLLLLAISVSGLVLLGLRDGPAMGILLAAHFGLIVAFFLLIPYSKMVHGLYRALALLKNAREIRQKAAASS
jgi:citrate/tricarballylate utilization protein